jgi:SET domain-containing protein
LVVEYTGELISSAEGTARERRSLQESGLTYILSIDDDWDIDGAVGGSDASYINHSCDPNCALEIDTKRRRAWIAAIKNIFEGEELTYDYFFEAIDNQRIRCACGSANCRGYINSIL